MDMASWGIQAGYYDVSGGWHDAPPATIEAVAAALGVHDELPPQAPMRFVRPNTHVPLLRPVTITTEDGGEVRADRALPPDLPLGYHRAVADDGEFVLVVTPGRCHPPPSRTWGWAVQLYALRSAASWGMGDLGDLRAMARWSSTRGAGMMLVNPLGAVLPIPEQQPSPYYPSSRQYRNPQYLRVEDIPGSTVVGADLDALARAGRALNHERLVDRDAVFALKMDAFERIWSAGAGLARAASGAWVAAQGEPLTRFATFCALAEQHGTGWHDWPAGYQHPDSPDVAAFAQSHADRIAFHQWLQFLVDDQLAAAGREIPVMTDLPIGVDRGGADAWLWQDTMALGMRVGAPPDEFNTQGQDWGLPPFDPWKLRVAAYEPFIATVRSALRHAGGLRIDHVMGLWRLFWIPNDAGPADGLYVRYPVSDLLDILALESVRAGAYIVGEDLGTVEEGVREELHDRAVLSTRLLWFEEHPPERYPELALAAVTTHDLATIPGLWTGADLQAQLELDLHPNEQSILAQRARLCDLVGLDDDAAVNDVVARTYERLARAPSRIVTATLDDALGVLERPNQPGTVDEWPNWRLALPVSFEAIAEDARVLAVARALEERHL